MAKIDIYSGFLGAGKTTLIKKLLAEAYSSEKVVLIENEFGEIGIDGGFLKDSGIEITEMNSGCICCSLVGDFTSALGKVIDEYHPDRIIIEPSGVGKLSDIIKAVKKLDSDEAVLNSYTTVADAGKCKMYIRNFGEFYNDQIKSASAIVLSHTEKASEKKVEEAVGLIKELNSDAVIITTPISKLHGRDILSAIEHKNTLEAELERMHQEHIAHEHHHEHGEECHCHEHHHEHGEECHCHEHHHEHGEECHCHEHSGHHHHADEVFASVGVETTKKFSPDVIKEILDTFDNSTEYGMILRAKGIVESENGEWIHFDYVPEEADVRFGSCAVIGRLCVIGSGIDKEKIKQLFGI